jgi:predicted nucleotidyltransferase
MNYLLTHLVDKVNADEAVLAVLLFGSHSRGDQTPKSDIDLCLVLPPDRDGRKDQVSVRMAYLEQNSGRLRIHVFQQLPLYIRARVLKEGRVLACKDWDALYAIASRTAMAFEDFKPIYRSYLDEVANAGS